MNLLNNYQNDLIKSRTTPLLIELNKKDLNGFSDESDKALAIAKKYAQIIYDKPIETHLKENENNILFIDAKKNTTDDNTVQILDHLLDNIDDTLKKAYSLDVAKKSASNVLSLAVGGVIGDMLSKDIEKGIDTIVDTISDAIVEDMLGYTVEEFEFTDKILESIEDKVLESVNNSIIEFADEIKETRLYLEKDAKDKLVALSKEFDPNLPAQKIFQIVSRLILSIAIGMPKVIFINNPQNLDKDSIAIISLLLSISKDIKDHSKHTGVSFIYTYSDEDFQPYQELKDKNYEDTKKLLDDQRRFAGRYAMLERPSSDIPTIAVKSSVFVGRVDELKQLSERFYYSKENPDKKTFEVIAADPGIGKTKLVKKHIEQLRHNDEYGSKLIQLTLLNQVRHSSSNTGLSSLIDSIIKEAERLEQVRTFLEQSLDYLKEKTKNTVVDTIKSTLGVNAIIDIGSSINDRLDLDKNIQDFSKSANKDLDNDKSSKEKQFEQLNSAINQLKKLSNKEELPIVLFIDDLQWIDDTSAEYITEHFSKINNVHIISTLRASDANTSLDQKYKNKTLNEYAIPLLLKANVQSNEIKENALEVYTNLTHHIENSENIKLPGFDNKTLNELISLTIKGDNQKHSLLAQTIINKISTTDKEFVNTLFAVETINMLCDKKLYEVHKYKDKNGNDITRQINKLILQNPLRYNEDVEFQNTLNEAFEIVEAKYHASLSHYNDRTNEKDQKFNLMAYAVLEERLHILQIYFKEYGNAAVNTLLFSSLLGTPFNSEIVKNVLIALSKTKEPLLEPLKEYINKSNQCNLEDTHYEIIEEVYEILSRYIVLSNTYTYKHNLLEIFLDKQLNYIIELKAKKKNIQEVEYKLFSIIHQVIIEHKPSLIPIKDNLSSVNRFDYITFYLSLEYKILIRLYDYEPSIWIDEINSNLINQSYYSTFLSYHEILTTIEKMEKLLVKESSQSINSHSYNTLLKNFIELSFINKYKINDSFFDLLTKITTHFKLLWKLSKSTNIAIEKNQIIKLLGDNYQTIGKVFFQKKDYKNAKLNFFKSYIWRKKLDLQTDKFNSINYILSCYIELNEINKGILLVKKFLNSIKELQYQEKKLYLTFINSYAQLLENNIEANYNILCDLRKEDYLLSHELYKENSLLGKEDYAISIHNYAAILSYKKTNLFNATKLLEEALLLKKELFKDNPKKYVHLLNSTLLMLIQITDNKNDISNFYQELIHNIQNNIEESLSFQLIHNYLNILPHNVSFENIPKFYCLVLKYINMYIKNPDNQNEICKIFANITGNFQLYLNESKESPNVKKEIYYLSLLIYRKYNLINNDVIENYLDSFLLNLKIIVQLTIEFNKSKFSKSFGFYLIDLLLSLHNNTDNNDEEKKYFKMITSISKLLYTYFEKNSFTLEKNELFQILGVSEEEYLISLYIIPYD